MGRIWRWAGRGGAASTRRWSTRWGSTQQFSGRADARLKAIYSTVVVAGEFDLEGFDQAIMQYDIIA